MRYNETESTCTPNLFVPGAGKSGTTSLHAYLEQHPDIYMSRKKEPHFFSHDRQYDNARSQYYSLFDSTQNYKYRGESSTGYMVFPNVCERISREISNPKFIFILRNPIDRAFSHYWWLVGIGIETKGFEEAFLRGFDDEPDAESVTLGRYRYYYQGGLYGKWLKRYVDHFGSNAIHIMTTESFTEDTLGSMNSCFAFLGLSSVDQLRETRDNQTVILEYPKLYNLIESATYKFLSPFPLQVQESIKDRLGGTKKRIMTMIDSKRTYPRLTAEQRRHIALVYCHDVELLKATAGLSFSEWHDFN